MIAPNTGYYMPNYAYFDWLEERGWDVGELRECEEWCYPFGEGCSEAIKWSFAGRGYDGQSYTAWQGRGGGYSGMQYITLYGDGTVHYYWD